MLSQGPLSVPRPGEMSSCGEAKQNPGLLRCRGSAGQRRSAPGHEGAGRPAPAALTPSVSLPPFQTSHRFPSENFKELHFYLFLHNYILFLIISFIHFSTFNFGVAAHSFF